MARPPPSPAKRGALPGFPSHRARSYSPGRGLLLPAVGTTCAPTWVLTRLWSRDLPGGPPHPKGFPPLPLCMEVGRGGLCPARPLPPKHGRREAQLRNAPPAAPRPLQPSL